MFLARKRENSYIWSPFSPIFSFFAPPKTRVVLSLARLIRRRDADGATDPLLLVLRFFFFLSLS